MFLFILCYRKSSIWNLLLRFLRSSSTTIHLKNDALCLQKHRVYVRFMWHIGDLLRSVDKVDDGRPSDIRGNEKKKENKCQILPVSSQFLVFWSLIPERYRTPCDLKKGGNNPKECWILKNTESRNFYSGLSGIFENLRI